jgi:tRNA threonylcarbamoyladenosine biosynthesis protein TsaE
MDTYQEKMAIPKGSRTYHLSITELDTFLKTFSKKLVGGEIIALIGDLGAGKTTLTQKLGKLLGIKKRITSPTYILLQEFTGRLPNTKLPNRDIIVYHLDLYRTNSFLETEALGLPEFWGKPGTITLIEWADKIAEHLPKDTITIYLV